MRVTGIYTHTSPLNCKPPPHTTHTVEQSIPHYPFLRLYPRHNKAEFNGGMGAPLAVNEHVLAPQASLELLRDVLQVVLQEEAASAAAARANNIGGGGAHGSDHGPVDMNEGLDAMLDAEEQQDQEL